MLQKHATGWKEEQNASLREILFETETKPRNAQD